MFSSSQRFVLIGIGAFGKEIARTLTQHHAEVLVIDHLSDNVNQLKIEGFEYVVHAPVLDMTLLRKFVKQDDIVILSRGDAFEDKLLQAEMLKDLGVKKIYARAAKDIQYKIMSRMELTRVLFPEKLEAKRFALELLNKGVVSMDEIAPNFFITEFRIPSKFIGKTIHELQIRSTHRVNIIALKEIVEDHQERSKQVCNTYSWGFENTPLQENHRLLTVGEESYIKQFKEYIIHEDV
ncbi:NAD-binding protein [Sediminitomix flava]|uniref:Trk system potassium uptake protein TrkA n=1 Tax=Sediminitomix flava TaxID=379075 RepID=A0A315Z5G9_SEDFL|nr:NAD-binding protein [Sediminitomix flava]PWJ39143.1 trk system potassium uptake protein TrkA [Sediminitomix flava]